MSLATAMLPAAANPVVERAETTSRGSLAGIQPIFAKDGVILSLLALFFQSNRSSGGSQASPARLVFNPEPSTTTGESVSVATPSSPHSLLDGGLHPHGSGSMAVTLAPATAVQATGLVPVSSVSLPAPDPAPLSGAVEFSSFSGSGGSFGSSLTMVLADPLRPQPLSTDPLGRGVLPGLPGSVTATPGPLPVAAALVGWQSARHLRRRRQRHEGPAERS